MAAEYHIVNLTYKKGELPTLVILEYGDQLWRTGDFKVITGPLDLDAIVEWMRAKEARQAELTGHIGGL